MNIVVCCSGGGGNFKAILDAQEKSKFKVALLIVDRVCGALDIAQEFGIPAVFVDPKNSKHDFAHDFESQIPASTDLIVLAGFIPIIPASVCVKWDKKIINTHPSLLPHYGGKGMIGVKVQEAVMAAGEKVAGCTVHYVSHEIDAGEIIVQASVLVDYQETPWQLGGRIFKEENRLLVEVIQDLCRRDSA
jgi:phosphoribosylglycinamide formyltransferase-1